MVTKEITVGERKFNIRELLAIEVDDIDWTNKPEAIKKQVILSTGMTDEEYKKLTVKERFSIIKVMNELNGFEELDFQKPTDTQKQ